MCLLEISSCVLKVGFGVYSQVAQYSEQYPGNRPWMFIKNSNDRNEIPLYTVNFREPGKYTSQNKPNPLICQHEKFFSSPSTCSYMLFLHILTKLCPQQVLSGVSLTFSVNSNIKTGRYSSYYNRF